MGEHITQTFGVGGEPYEPESSYEWDYGESDPPHARPKVLWGRVAALGGGLLVAFLVGRASAPGGIPEKDLIAVQSALADAEAEIEEFRAQQRVLPPVATPDADETPADGDKSSVQTYIVQAGDTLRGIAEEFYGDAELADLLAEYNDIDDPATLEVGMELKIPPKPEE